MKVRCQKCAHITYIEVGTVSDVANDQKVTRGAVAGWKRTHKGHPEAVDHIRGGEELHDLAEWRAFCKTHKLGKR